MVAPYCSPVTETAEKARKMVHESSPEDPNLESPMSAAPLTPLGEPPDLAPEAPEAPESSPPPSLMIGPSASVDTTAVAPVVVATTSPTPPSETPPIRLGTGVAETSSDVDYENQTTRVDPNAVTTTNQRLHVSRDAVVVSQDELEALNTSRPEGPPSLAVASPPPIPPYATTDTSLVDLGEAIADERDDDRSRPPWWNIGFVLLPILLALGGYGIWHTMTNDDSASNPNSQDVATDGSSGEVTESESDVSVGVDTADPDSDSGLEGAPTPIESESDVSIGVDVEDNQPSDDESGLEGAPTPIESESDVSIGVDVEDDLPSDDESGLEDAPTPTESESDVSIGVDADEGEPSGRFDFSESGGNGSGAGGGGDNSSGSIGGFAESGADSSLDPSDNGGSGGGSGGGDGNGGDNGGSGSGSGGGDNGGSGGGSGGGDNGGSGGGSGGGDNGGSGGGNGGGTGVLRTASIDFQSEYGPITPSVADDPYTFEKYDVPDTDVSFFIPKEYPTRSDETTGQEVDVYTYSTSDEDWYSPGIYASIYGSASVEDRINADAAAIGGSDGCDATETTELPLDEDEFPGQFFADPISVGDWKGYYAYYASCSSGQDPLDFVNIVFDTEKGLVDIIARVATEEDLVAIDRFLQSITL